MKMKPRYKKSSLLPQKKRDDILIDSARKANLVVTICVLHDCFGFGKKRINDFMDRYVEFAESYDAGNESLQSICDEIWERFGVKVL